MTLGPDAKIVDLDAQRESRRNDAVPVECRHRVTGGPRINGTADEPAGTDVRRAVSTLETAIEAISAQQGELGAAINRLDVLIADLRAESENASVVMSRLMDLDMAAALTATLKAQIIRQPAMAWLAQAKSLPGNLLQFPVKPPT